MNKLTPLRISRAVFNRFNKVLGQSLGYQLQKYDPNWLPVDFTHEDREVFEFVKPYTLTSPERIISLRQAVKHIVDNRLEGSFVECGVWRGGSMMAVAKTLLYLNEKNRDLFLFDTYEGMSEPTALDVDHKGESATENWQTLNTWVAVSEARVKENILKTGYDASKIHLIKGKVEDTLPEKAPAKIALLRLDTDWYESTKHELEHLYPRLVQGGILIIDDYGHFKGSRQATDEYFARHGIKTFLHRIDYTARMIIKP
ncbi:MAG: class I SAM-dependent methyltransferase [Bdellovibrionaceae bacterium]|nr:class I SAM-dependent methyltransferase [Pseudobdellovibrionaceae bacterium]